MGDDTFIPVRGDIVWTTFSPQRGHEERGRRPAIVLSKRSYNERSGLALVCPITSRVKGYPFEVPIKLKKIMGVALADQVRSIDWRARDVKLIETLDKKSLRDIARIAAALITTEE